MTHFTQPISRLIGIARGLAFTLGLLVFADAAPVQAQIPAGDPVVNIWPSAATPVVPTIQTPGVFDQLSSSTYPFYSYYNSVFWSASFPAWAGTKYQTLQTFPYTYTEPVSQRTNGYVIRFNSDSPRIILGLKDASIAFRLMVDGGLVADISRPTGTGNLIQYTFDFGTAQTREFQILADNVGFQGIHVADTSRTITPSPDVGPRAVFMGDSIGEGTTGSLNFVVGRLMGWTPWNVPWGGTGYIADNNGTRTNFYGRYSDITQAQPQIVVISGGINDNGYIAADNGAAFQAKVEQLFSQVKTDLPSATKIAVGPFWPNYAPIPEIYRERDIVQTAAAKYGFVFIDWLGWITGTYGDGGPGNANIYISSDHTHPTGAGRNYLGARLAAAIAKALGQPVPGGLDSLVLNSGSLTPAFDPLIQNYQVNVPYAVSNLTLTPTASYTGTTVQANVNSGSYVAAPLGAASPALPLAVGTNTVDVQVSGKNGMIVTHYTLNVTRATASTNANLSALGLSAGNFTPAFAPATTSYSANVANAVANTTVTPTVTDATATVQVRINGGSYSPITSDTASASMALVVGVNPIDLLVTAEDGVTVKTYTVSLTRPPSSNANLSSLAIDSGTLTPTFDSQTTSYSATVDNLVTSVAITPILEDPTALFLVSGGTSLAVGANTADVRVTAQDATTIKDYIITINRLPTPFDIWKQVRFGDQADDPSVAGDLASPAGDGVSNILKYALGLDPHAVTPKDSLPEQGLEGDLLTLCYTKIKAATDISYNVVWSHDLITWSSDGVTEAVVPGTDTPTSQKIKATVPTNGVRQQLIRLKVARLPLVP